MAEIRLALDRASVRRVDPETGHLHVSSTPISISAVNPYRGNEIPGWEDLGLDASRVYKLYRDPDELEKAAKTFDGKPLLITHKPVHADDHPHNIVVGNVGNVVWQPPYLMAGLNIWTKEAIDGIESGGREQLSCGYGYKPVMRSGRTPDGDDYDGVMTSIHGNHCSLVPEGRAGPTVYVHDSALSPTELPKLKEQFLMPKTAVPSRTAAMAQGALMVYARSRLAQDKKLDLNPLFKGVTAQNLKAKAPAIAAAFDAQIRPVLATDADMDQADVQAIVEQVAEVVAERADLIAAEVEAPAGSMDPDATTDADDAELRAMLKAKGYSDAEMDMICAKTMPMTSSAPTMDAEAKTAEMKAATDAAVKMATKGMISKEAMDAAIAAAVTVASDSALQHQRALRDAEAHVRPAVGALVAQDSAEGVFRAALKALNVAGVDALPEAALKPVFDAHATAKLGPAKLRPMAQDGALKPKTFDEMFPNTGRLRG